MWVSAIPVVTARFPSVWVGYCDLCDLPEGRSVIQYLASYRRVYKLQNCITLTSCTRVKSLVQPGLFFGIIASVLQQRTESFTDIPLEHHDVLQEWVKQEGIKELSYLSAAPKQDGCAVERGLKIIFFLPTYILIIGMKYFMNH